MAPPIAQMARNAWRRAQRNFLRPNDSCLNEGLVAWWPFNTPLDKQSSDNVDHVKEWESINGFHLIHNDVGFNATTGYFPFPGGGYYLNPTETGVYVRMPTVTKNKINDLLGGQASFAAILKREGVGTGGIWTHWGTANSNDVYPWSSGNLFLSMLHSSRPDVGPPLFDTDEWHILSSSDKSGANNWRIFQNGSLLHQGTGDAAPGLGTTPDLGRDLLIADIRIWDRYLSDEEHARLAEDWFGHIWTPRFFAVSAPAAPVGNAMPMARHTYEQMRAM